MTVRQSKIEDLPILMELYRQARQIQLDSGNLHQWVEGFPPETLILRDINNRTGFCIEDDGMVAGAFTLIVGEDPTYSSIEDGEWIDDTLPYATIHRLAALKGHGGIARTCFDWCIRRHDNLRVDTHEDNAIMRHCIEKAGFRYCGIIHVADGSPRRAYQRIIIKTKTI